MLLISFSTERLREGEAKEEGGKEEGRREGEGEGIQDSVPNPSIASSLLELDYFAITVFLLVVIFYRCQGMLVFH